MKRLYAVLLAIPLCYILLIGVLGLVSEVLTDYVFFRFVGVNILSLKVAFFDDPFLWSYVLITAVVAFFLVQLKRSVKVPTITAAELVITESMTQEPV